MKRDEIKNYSKLTDDELIAEIAELRACEDLTEEFYGKLCKYTYLLSKAENEHEDRISQ